LSCYVAGFLVREWVTVMQVNHLGATPSNQVDSHWPIPLCIWSWLMHR